MPSATTTTTWPAASDVVDLHAHCAAQGIDLDDALARLRKVYDLVDEANARNTGGLDLPCHSGCSACCEDAVFMSELEFMALWHFCQTHVDDDERARMVHRSQRLVHDHAAVFAAMADRLARGEHDLTDLAMPLRLRCPILNDDGACQAYSWRELWGRLFGQSFNDEGGIYGCHLVGDHLIGRQVTLLPARATARRLLGLPLTRGSQLLPAWVVQWYGPGAPDLVTLTTTA